MVGFDPFKLCRRKSIVGVGWSRAYEEQQASNIAEAKLLVRAKYDQWPYPIKYLIEDVKQGDHIWLHKDGNYYLCKASDKNIFGERIDKNYINYDLGHAKKVEWVEVPEIYVSGSIQRGTIAQRMIQRIKITKKEQEFHQILFGKLSIDPNWQPTINEVVLESMIKKMNMSDMFQLMTPDDTEDIISAYLQTQGWILVKSTCFRSKPVFEFSMLNKKHETCQIQVKSGNNPNPLAPSEYKNYTDFNKFIYLFSTNKNPYPGASTHGVKPIDHQEIFEWIKNNTWALTIPLKYRLWIYLNGK